MARREDTATVEAVDLEIMPQSAIQAMDQAMNMSLVDVAKRYPRGDLKRIQLAMISMATLDEETAASCYYTLFRKAKDETTGQWVNKPIMGPSVRLAEIAFSCYKNLRAGARPVSNDGQFITSQGVCWDLENNTFASIESMRRITNKNGDTLNDDMQVVISNAANSIAFRNAVFKVIPGTIIKTVFEQARLTAVGNVATLKEKRDKYLKRLEELGATRDRVLRSLGLESVEAIGLAQLDQLVGAGTALRDGVNTLDELFPPIEKQQPGTAEDAAKVGQEKVDKLRNEATGGSATGQSTKVEETEVADSPEQRTLVPDTDETVAAPKNLGHVHELPEAFELKPGTVCYHEGREMHVQDDAWRATGKLAPPAPDGGDHSDRPTGPRAPNFRRKS